MNNQILRVGIVGCGDMGNRHAAAWAEVPGAQLYAVVDNKPESACALAERYHAPHCCHDYRQALALPDLDVVSVCIPTAFHAEVSLFAMQQHKHVFCEKPIALTLEDADAMIALAERQGVQLGVAFLRRYSPVFEQLRTLLASGAVGRPVMAHSVDIREQRPKLMMHDRELTGGAVVDMGVHIFDTWANLFDSPAVEVFAQGLLLATGRPELTDIAELAHDTAAVTVRYASGDCGIFVITWGLPLGVQPEPTPERIYAPDGLVEVTLDFDQQWLRLNTPESGWETLVASDENLYSLEIAAFAADIRSGRAPRTGGVDGREALRVALAAVEAIETRRVVHL